jgi:hypothetical protein
MGRAGVLQPFALGHYGLLAVGCSWHPVVLVCAKGKKAPAMLARSLGVVSLAFIGAGKNKPGLVAPSSTQEKKTWSRARPSIDAGKKNLVPSPKIIASWPRGQPTASFRLSIDLGDEI